MSFTLSVIMLHVVMLSVVILNVVAPKNIVTKISSKVLQQIQQNFLTFYAKEFFIDNHF
jgi:hypothetical protein